MGLPAVTYIVDGAEITLDGQTVKNYLVQGQGNVTDQEVMMFISLCKYRGLNPFIRDAYLIKYGSSPASIVTGKDYFVRKAAECPAFKGIQAGIIVEKEDGSIENRIGTFYLKDKDKEKLVGGWAKGYREGWDVPVEISVSLDEYVRYNSKGEIMHNWRAMPATMIRKVALVQVLREEFPDVFGGLYAPEEMPVDESKLNDKPVDIPVQHDYESQFRHEMESWLDTMNIDHALAKIVIKNIIDEIIEKTGKRPSYADMLKPKWMKALKEAVLATTVTPPEENPAQRQREPGDD